MVTIYDIAKKANVSAMTVSRVINNSGRISDKTRAHVKIVMEELNYMPNSLARSLVLQESKILSLLIVDITNPFYTTVSRGAEDAALKNGYKMFFSNSDEDLAKEKAYVDMIVSARVDGVLFAPAGDASIVQLERLRKHRIPVVLIDREVPGTECDTVLGDSTEGAKKLVELLISMGHRHIALVNGSPHVSTARYRRQGYLEALKLNDIEPDSRLMIEAGYKWSDLTRAEQAVDQLWRLEKKPTAIFAANNILAVEVIHALRNKGLTVPGDVSVVCFDDLGLASVIDPFLTVAAQPAYQFGEIGIQLLIERIQANEASPWKKIILPCELLVRQSAKPLS